MIKDLELLELVHCNMCVLMKATSHGGAQYFVTFMDDFLKKNSCLFLENEMRSV
jgi:hypothetical protein